MTRIDQPGPPARRRWDLAVIAGILLATLLVTIGTVLMSAATLGEVSAEMIRTQSRVANLTNADRKLLLLLGIVGTRDSGVTPEQIAVQRGLVIRHITVGIAAYPPGSAEVAELTAIRNDLQRLRPEEMAAAPSAEGAAARGAHAQLQQSELRVNALRSAEEKRFYSSTSEVVRASQRSLVSLTALVAVVLALGFSGIAVIRWLGRSNLMRAYDRLSCEVAERRAAEDALRTSEARFRSLVQHTSDLTVVTDASGVINYISPSAEALLGQRPAELFDRSLLDCAAADTRPLLESVLAGLLADPASVRTVELQLITADGPCRQVEAMCQNLLDDPDVAGLVWNGRDVTERRALQDELTHQAGHDPLTGLPNRSLLISRLGAAIAEGPERARDVAVILFDLDGFKSVNDSLGHATGDELLRAAAARLLECVHPSDLPARLGGDEFAVVAGVRRPEQAVQLGQRIVEALRRPFPLSAREVRVSASAGIAYGGHHAETAEDLLRNADIAMYAARNTGKGHVEVFESDMRARAADRISLQQDLARAVDHGEMSVYYQPVIDLARMRPRMLEALTRWRRSDGTMIPASTFIPLAEESGAIMEIGREVLRRACRDLQTWRQTLPDQEHLGISVNVSMRQVLSGRLAEQVTEALRESGLPPSKLVLEITESIQFEDTERVRAELARLRELGVLIAVDDYGSGYSSLGYLLGIDADVLKIDRTLLDFDTTRSGSLVNAIADLGRMLGLVVVTEGVETVEHLRRAVAARADAAQGYYLAPALPVDQVADFLTTEWPSRRERFQVSSAPPG